MIKFFYGNRENTDAEESLERINRYVILMNNADSSVNSNIDLFGYFYDLNQYVTSVNSAYAVNPTLSEISSSRIKRLVKKVVRKCIQWAFNDITAKQNEFNGKVTQYINSETILLKELSNECVTLREENDKLKAMLITK